MRCRWQFLLAAGICCESCHDGILEKSIAFQRFWRIAYFRYAGLRHIICVYRILQVCLELFAKSSVATSHRSGCTCYAKDMIAICVETFHTRTPWTSSSLQRFPSRSEGMWVQWQLPWLPGYLLLTQWQVTLQFIDVVILPKTFGNLVLRDCTRHPPSQYIGG